MNDEAAVAGLIARIARTADMAVDLEDNMTLYLPDAVWQFGDLPPVMGQAQLRVNAERRRADGVTGPGAHSRHLISTVSVEVDGDAAVAESYWQFFVDTAGQPRLDSMGAYRDTCVRTPDGWRLARREITPG